VERRDLAEQLLGRDRHHVADEDPRARDLAAQRLAIEADEHAALADLLARVLQPRPGRAAQIEHALAGREDRELGVELFELPHRSREEAFALGFLMKAIATDGSI